MKLVIFWMCLSICVGRVVQWCMFNSLVHVEDHYLIQEWIAIAVLNHDPFFVYECGSFFGLFYRSLSMFCVSFRV